MSTGGINGEHARAGWVISIDEALGDIRDGEIYIVDDTIAAVGHKIEVATDEIIDAPNMIALPGLINSHMHTWEVGLRGLGFDWAGPDYYRNVHGNLATRYQPRDNYLANPIGALNQIDNGVTTLFDWCHNLRDLEMAEASVEGLKASRIRAVFGHGTAKPSPVKGGDAPHARVPHPRERVAALRKGLLSSDDGLITMALCILGPDQSPPEITSHDFKLARADPVRMVVTCGAGELIDTVLVDGEIRKRGGVLAWPKASLDKNVAELLQSAARIRREAGLEVEPLAA